MGTDAVVASAASSAPSRQVWAAGIATVLKIFLMVINILFLAGAIITPETKGKFE
jgi:hypothetical protein